MYRIAIWVRKTGNVQTFYIRLKYMKPVLMDAVYKSNIVAITS